MATYRPAWCNVQGDHKKWLLLIFLQCIHIVAWNFTQLLSNTRCSAIAERPRCRVRYSFRQKWKTGTERQYFTDIIGLSSISLWYNRPENLWNSVKKCKIRAITAFKVIQGHRGRKPVCDFLLVINSNWHPISYRFRVIAVYCSNFGHFAFLSLSLGSLGTTYDVHLGLIGKRVVDFLLVLIEPFSLGVTAEALWANIGWKSAISLQQGPVDPKFQVEGVTPHQPFFFSQN